MSRLKRRGKRGQIIIMFAIIYLSLILNLIHVLPRFSQESESPSYHVRIVNLMLKRITDASLAWACNGGNFSQYLDWCLSNLLKYYPVLVSVLDYSVIMEEGLRQASVTYIVSYSPFNIHYQLKCVSKLQVLSITNLVSPPSPSPSFKSRSFEVKILLDEPYMLDSIIFSALFFDGSRWHPTYVKVVPSFTSYKVVLTVPLNATLIKLLVGDWRGITVDFSFKV